MPRRLSLEQQWRSFEIMTGVAATSPIQRKEMRRAFYAGASSIMDAIVTSLDPGTEPTDADMEYMDSLTKELSQFASDIAAGRA